MIAKDDIIIRKAILHILDTTHGECILSEQLLDPGPDLYEFIRGHIFKIINSDDTKSCFFNPETSPLYPVLTSWDENDEDSFIKTSQIVGERLYQEMGESPDIPAADLLFVTFQAKGEIYLTLLKLNYKENYTHQIKSTNLPEESEGSGIHASIVKSSALFPSSSSRIPEAVIIRLSDLEIKLIEKKYEINGEKIFYLSENFLVCTSSLPTRKKINILTKVINSITNKYDDADLKAKMDTKSALLREYQDNNEFNIEEIGQSLFGKSPEKKAEFDEKMEEFDLQFDRFSVSNENTVKKLDRQIIQTDSGIEISIPMDVYNKLAHFEVTTDVTGKSTIIIKDVDNLIIK